MCCYKVKEFLSDEPATPLGTYIKSQAAALSLGGANRFSDDEEEESEEEEEPIEVKKSKNGKKSEVRQHKPTQQLEDGEVGEDDIVEAFEGFSDDDDDDS